MTRYFARRRAALALLLAMALALLAACGGAPAAAPTAAPTAATARENTAAQALKATAAPAAPAMPAATGVAAAEAAVVGDAAAPPPAASGAADGVAAAAPISAATSTNASAVRPLGQEAGLKAGEINDNDRFAAYLDYLQAYQGGGVRLADVGERYLIRVIGDGQRPVIDARVTIYADDQEIFHGRTYAGGQTIFLPRALGVSPNITRFRAVATYASASAEVSFDRSPGASVEIGLRGVQPDSALRLDLLFLLDTTGSMGDELGRIQQTIDSIAQRIDAFTPRPQIRYGLVAYRDRGDDYVTRPVDFTTDLGQFRSALTQLAAAGGGDTPEAVDEAMYDAIMRASWSDQPAVRLVFLVADAGPHTDAQSQFTYLDGAREATARGVKIYPIAASNSDAPAEYVFRQLAQQTMGGFVFLTYQPGQSAGAPGESTTLEAGDQPYSVERLDDLIVSIVERELAAAVGAR
ncbi:MAG: vWA domain-containing protein [Chloroflexales bacterium]